MQNEERTRKGKRYPLDDHQFNSSLILIIILRLCWQALRPNNFKNWKNKRTHTLSKEIKLIQNLHTTLTLEEIDTIQIGDTKIKTKDKTKKIQKTTYATTKCSPTV